jgi:hypothetical protein
MFRKLGPVCFEDFCATFAAAVFETFFPKLLGLKPVFAQLLFGMSIDEPPIQ